MPGSPRSPEAPILELPELDKSEDTDDVDVGSFELNLGEELALDEDEHKVDVFQVDIQELSDEGDNAPATELDIGSQLLDALPDSPREASEDEAAAVLDGELDLHLEQPIESDEPSSDVELGDDGLEALPELTNEDGDGDAGPDVERAFLPSAPEGEIPTGDRYEAEWLLLGTATTALCAARAGVLAAAGHLMRFTAPRQSVPLPAGVFPTSIADTVAGAALLVTARGLLEVAATGAITFLEAPELARGNGAEIVEILAAPDGALWARLASGALIRRRAHGWERHETFGRVRSLTGQGSNVTLLVLGSRPALQLSNDSGASFHERLLPEPARTVAQGAAPCCAAQGNVVAIADAQRGLAVSSDGGATFRMVTGAVNVTALTIGDKDGAACVFAALYREGRDATALIAVEPTTGDATRIAELSGDAEEETEESGRTSALLYVDGYLWAAGGYGLGKLARV